MCGSLLGARGGKAAYVVSLGDFVLLVTMVPVAVLTYHRLPAARAAPGVLTISLPGATLVSSTS